VSSYFVAKNGEQGGPFSMDEIVSQLSLGTIGLTDYIFDEVLNDWVMLMSYEKLNLALAKKKPSLPPPEVTAVNFKIDPKNMEKSEQEPIPEITKQETKFTLPANLGSKPIIDVIAESVSESTPGNDNDMDELSAFEEFTAEIDILALNNDSSSEFESGSLAEAFGNISNSVYHEKIEEIKNGEGSIKEKALKISRALEEVVDPIMSEWYILKDNNKYGPYTYKDMLNMLNEKFIYGYDFVWHNSLSNWRRLANLEAFTDENINKLKNTFMPELTQTYSKRRHKRVGYGHSIMVHDNSRLWKAQSVQISEGGVGVVMEQAHVVTGQTLYLHFKPGDGVPPFNAVCEVISKKLQENKETKKTEILYALKFLKISNDISDLVSSISKSKKSA